MPIGHLKVTANLSSFHYHDYFISKGSLFQTVSLVKKSLTIVTINSHLNKT